MVRPPRCFQLDRVLPLGPFTAGMGDRARVHLSQPRRGRGDGHVGHRRPVRTADDALLLDRRRTGDALPGCRDDAVLLRLQGALGPRVHADAIRHRRPPGERAVLRFGPGADRRCEPLPAGYDRQPPAGLAAVGRPDRGSRHRARLHHPRRSVRGDLQRGAAVLRDRGGAAAPDTDRSAPRRWLGRPDRTDQQRRDAGCRTAQHLARRAAVRIQQPGPQRDRHRLRTRLRALLRLLDDELRRGPAGDGLEEHHCRPDDPDHRRLPEDVHPVHRRHPRHDRRGAGERTGRLQASLLHTPRARRLPQRAGSPTTTRCCC